MRQKNQSIQEQAVACVRNLCVNAENAERLVEDGAVVPLIQLLRSSSKKIQENACLALRNITGTGPHEVKVVMEGGLPPLIALLSSQDRDLQEHSRSLRAQILFLDFRGFHFSAAPSSAISVWTPKTML